MYFPPIKNPEEITKDPTLRVMKPWWIILIGAAILYLVPAQAVLSQPMVGTAIEWLASLIPSIARWVELSPFPANTKLFFVFAWAMVPVQAYWLVTSVATKNSFQASYLAKSTEQTLIIRIVALLCFFVFFGGMILLAFKLAIVDTELCRICVNTSRSAQLFIGCLTAMAFSMVIAFFLTSLPIFFKSLTSKEKNHV